jgi:lipopolysaccharide/colanic/teichoic acid biosynthesis glycosyltransferase
MFFSTLQKAMGAQKLLFLGSSHAVREIVAHLAERPELGLASIGYLENGHASSVPGTPKLGSLAELDAVLTELHPARIVVGVDPLAPEGLPVERLLELRLAGLQIEEASATYEMVFRRVSTRDLPPSQLIFANEMSPRATSVTLHSGYSLFLGLLGLVVALPAMAIIALIVKLVSPGPVLFRQQCAGLHGELFSVLRFRPLSWLRRFHLDALPELFNVVRGEMTIVGPRPERPEFAAVLEEKIPYYRQRLCVKPGMTGWAQLNEKDPSAIEDSIAKLEYDRYYIKNLSLSLDAYIIFHTLKAILLGR